MKRLLSIILVFSMILPMAVMPVSAEIIEIPLEASRLNAEGLPEGNLVYMGTASVNLKESDAIYSFPVYREGDLSGEASVDIHTLDLTAVYGKDYEIVEQQVEETGGDVSLLEKYATMEAPEGESEGMLADIIEDAADEMTDETEEAMEPAETIEAAGEEAAEEAEAMEIEPEEQDGPKSLRQLKEESTGLKTRDPEDTVIGDGVAVQSSQQEVQQAFVDEYVPEAMQSVEYSSSTTITFAPGEAEKILRFRIFDDNDSEGAEGFSLLLVNPQGAELHKVTSLSVSIEDNEEPVRSEISFAKSKYKSKDGKAVIKIVRNGAEHTLCDFVMLTSGQTATAGENYKEYNDVVTFMPYETEKEIEIPVTGKGEFKVLMKELSGCNEGKHIEATVKINEDTFEENIELQSDEQLEMGITIDGKSYTVKYTMPSDSSKDPATGIIYADGYDLPPEVGTYYFATDKKRGGIFNYGKYSGDEPYGAGFRHSDYSKDSNIPYMAYDSHYGRLEYYHTYIKRKGKAYTTSDKIDSTYYQFLAPNWTSTTGTYGGQKARFKAGDHYSDVKGEFGRTLDKGVIRLLDEKDGAYSAYNEKINMSVYAIDDTTGRTPKNKVRFYGVAAMYKKLTAKVIDVAEKNYLTGSGDSKASYKPVQVSIKSGVQRAGSQSREFYLNTDINKTSLVFNIDSSNVNGRSDKYGVIKGYSIKLEPNNANGSGVTLNYPEDYISFINKQSGKITDALDYEDTIKTSIIKKVNERLDTIPITPYFMHWLESKQNKVNNEGGSGYYRGMVITPVVDYVSVNVEVLPPAEGSGHFTYSPLQAGKILTYHAGDVLDMGVVSDDTNYRVMGYQVSVDGGKNYNYIQDSNKLHLEPNKNYKIRPYLAANTNRVEIIFENGAEKYLNIQNLISDNEINAADKTLATELNGKKVLNLNPAGANLTDKINPVVGEIYTLSITSINDGKYVYRPIIKHNNNTYITNSYYFAGAKNMSDNIITVSYEKVAKSSLSTFNVSGTVVSANAPVKTNGLEIKKIPVSGYTVAIGKGTQIENSSSGSAGGYIADSASGGTNNDGEYILSGIKGKSGDLTTIYISNGLTKGYVKSVKLSANGGKTDGVYEVKAGISELEYPYGAPKVTSVSYSYDKTSNNQATDNDANQIRIMDDNLNLLVVVDGGANNRTIEKAIFTVHKTTGDTLTYDGWPVVEGSNVYTCSIQSMTEKFNSGDYISVRLVDKEKLVMDGGKKIDIEYPDVDLGYTMYTASDLVNPQNFKFTDSPTLDIPLIGNATGYSESGVLNFSKTYWDDEKTGYTISVNLDTVIGGSPINTSGEKREQFKEFHEAGKTAKTRKQTAADFLATNFPGGPPKPGMSSKDYAPYKNYEDANRAYTDNLQQAKKPMSGFNSTEMAVRVAFVLGFDFIKGASGDYIFSCGTVAIGGGFSFEKTMYSMISNVPVFLNIQAGIQVDTVITYTAEAGKVAITAGEFEEYTNLAEDLYNDDCNMTIVISGKIQVGVGLCGVLSARGYAATTFEFDIACEGGDSGALITIVGGVGFDLLILSIDIDIIKATWGFGTLKDASEVDFFNGILPLSSDDTNGTMHKYNMGTADMSQFGKNDDISLSATPEIVSSKIVLEDVAERTRPHIIPLDNENKKKMIVFIGNGVEYGKDEANAATLFYSVCDEIGNWSTPVPVDPGSETFDTTPEVEKVGNKVYIAWADAGEKIAESDSVGKALNKLDVSGIIYDISTGTMGEKIEIVHETENKFFDALPQISVDGNELYISYLKRDLSDMNVDEINVAEFLKSFNKAYSTMVYKEYNTDTGTLCNNGDEVFLHIPSIDEDLDDSLVLDLHSEITTMDGDTYMVSTFTIDLDRDMNTSGDREIFLWIVKTGHNSDDLMYYPIQITTGDDAESTPKLTKVKTYDVSDDGNTVEEREEVYLTWLTNGYLFNLAEVSDMLKAMFDPVAPMIPDEVNETEGTVPMYDVEHIKNIYKSGYVVLNEDANGEKEIVNLNADWYKKSAADLGIDADVYEGSIFADLANNNFRIQTANFATSEEIQQSISDYVVTHNGKDVYIYYTNFGEDRNNTGKELFGVRYRRKGTEQETIEAGQEKELDDGTISGRLNSNRIIKPEQWGFAKAVQITNENKVLDEIDLYMTENNQISMVSNFFEQWIDENDTVKPIKYSSNKLVQVEFEPVSSLEIMGSGVSLPEKMIPGNTETLKLGIKNNGLLDAVGYEVKIWVHKDGNAGVELLNNIYKEPIPAGETVYVDIPLSEDAFSNPETFDGLKIETEVKEILEYKSENEYIFGEPERTTQDIPYETKLDVRATKIEQREDGYYFTGNIYNNGFKTSDEVKLVLIANADDAEKTRIVGEATSEALISGAEKYFEFKVDMDMEDFNHLGVIEYKLTAEAGDVKAEAFNSFNTPKPIMAEINEGAEQIALDGEDAKVKLTSKAAPWNDYSGEIEFYSEDNGVAVVDEEGNVTPTGDGTTKLHVFYPKYGIGDEITVVVANMNSEEGNKQPVTGVGGSSNSNSTGVGVPAGSISFSTNGGTLLGSLKVNSNGTINEPAAPTKEGYVFDGWYKDEALTEKFDFNDKVDGNITLYAKWITPEEAEANKEEWNKFTDVTEDDWFYNEVKKAYEMNLITGTTDTEFEPNAEVTRGMFVTLLHRAEGEPPAPKLNFSDVPSGEYYTEAIAWANANGIVTGYSDTEFGPDDAISREQMATILFRYATYKGMEAIALAELLGQFADSDKVSEYAISALNWAVGSGIIQGKENNILDPQGTATRAEAAAILVRFLAE